MKLASLKHGRDGRLVVVSNDLAWYADATTCATLPPTWSMKSSR
jgi:fumarylacetoacetate (FAA) hydrolase